VDFDRKAIYLVEGLALASGVDPVAVAAQTGQDVRTLYENYAGVIRRVELPGLEE
jgi:hypothetical protein